MRGGGEGGAVGAGEAGGSALRFTENSQQLVEVCVHMAGLGFPLARTRVGSEAGGWGDCCPGRAPPREACPARTKWASVFSANLPLDGNFGS